MMSVEELTSGLASASGDYHEHCSGLMRVGYIFTLKKGHSSVYVWKKNFLFYSGLFQQVLFRWAHPLTSDLVLH